MRLCAINFAYFPHLILAVATLVGVTDVSFFRFAGRTVSSTLIFVLFCSVAVVCAVAAYLRAPKVLNVLFHLSLGFFMALTLSSVPAPVSISALSIASSCLFLFGTLSRLIHTYLCNNIRQLPTCLTVPEVALFGGFSIGLLLHRAGFQLLLLNLGLLTFCVTFYLANICMLITFLLYSSISSIFISNLLIWGTNQSANLDLVSMLHRKIPYPQHFVFVIVPMLYSYVLLLMLFAITMPIFGRSGTHPLHSPVFRSLPVKFLSFTYFIIIELCYLSLSLWNLYLVSTVGALIYFITIIPCVLLHIMKWRVMGTFCQALKQNGATGSMASVMSSKGMRISGLSGVRITYFCVFYTMLTAVVWFWSCSYTTVVLFFMCLACDLAVLNMLRQLSLSLADATLAYALVAQPTVQQLSLPYQQSPRRPFYSRLWSTVEVSTPIVAPEDYAALSERYYSLTSLWESFFSGNSINTYVSEYCCAEDLSDSLHTKVETPTDTIRMCMTRSRMLNKLQHFFAQQSPTMLARYDTYILYYCGASDMNGDWIFQDGVLSLQDLISCWEQSSTAHGIKASRLLVIIDSPYASVWCDNIVTLGTDAFIAIQAQRCTSHTDFTVETVGEFTKAWIMWNQGRHDTRVHLRGQHNSDHNTSAEKVLDVTYGTTYQFTSFHLRPLSTEDVLHVAHAKMCLPCPLSARNKRIEGCALFKMPWFITSFCRYLNGRFNRLQHRFLYDDILSFGLPFKFVRSPI